MNNFCIPNSCCPPEDTAVVTVQTVDGIKGLNNCFVRVLDNNTVYYVDKAHRITIISSNSVEVENYDVATNLQNFRNQFVYDSISKDLFYFDNRGDAIAFSSVVSEYQINKILAQVNTNKTNISNLQAMDQALLDGIADEAAKRTAEVADLKSTQDEHTEILNSFIDKQVQLDTALSSDASAVTLTKTLGRLGDASGLSTDLSLPVASTTSAGVMNAATFAAVQDNAEKVDAILNGAVGLENVPADPTQEELNELWKAATGQSEIINRASIYDVTNDKVWYYYTNISEWKSVKSTGGEVNISTFTNETAGIIKGSDVPGQLFAEPDGTGSVVGWDSVQHDLQNLVELVNANPIPKLPTTLVTTTANQRNMAFISNTLTHSISLRVPNYNPTTEQYDTSYTATLPNATTSNDGSMSYTDKSKLDKITNESITRSNNLPIQVFYNTGPTDYNSDDIEVHLIMKDLHTGGDATMTFGINSAVPSGEGVTGKAGIMSVTQATQLAALASAYEAEEKGTVLYESTASVNNIELSESGLSYDHLIVVAEYMGMGSAALKQQVSTVFYPTDNVKAFQMNATDITVGDAPSQVTVQDIWMISEDGLELDLVSSIKSTIVKNGTLGMEVMPDSTSMFTITKVIGFWKKV